MKRRVQFVVLCIVISSVWLSLFLSAVSADDQKPSVDFDREVRPILSDNCFACHGPDEN